MTAGATTGTATTPAAPRRPRHTHSPRVRRAAAENALTLDHLDRLTGSGRGGRVTVADVVRAAERRTVDPPADTTAGDIVTALATALIEVDVTRIPADGLLSTVVRAAAEAALAEAPDVVSRGVVVVRGGDARAVPDAADLTAEGIQRRLSTEGHRAGEQPLLAVVDAGARGILLDTAPPPEGTLAAIGVGAPSDRPAVVHDADGLPSIAVRSIAYLTVTYDLAAVTSEVAGRLLTAIAGRLHR